MSRRIQPRPVPTTVVALRARLEEMLGEVDALRASLRKCTELARDSGARARSPGLHPFDAELFTSEACIVRMRGWYVSQAIEGLEREAGYIEAALQRMGEIVPHAPGVN